MGIVGLQPHEPQGALDALVRALATINEPIALTRIDTVVSEGPDELFTDLKSSIWA